MRRPLSFAALLLCGCLRVPPAPTPMAFVADPFPGGQRAKCLLVLLPGARDRAETFRDEHFLEDLRASGLSVDVIAADLTLGYYFQNAAALRLETDVIAPARSKGYRQVWLLGISMGGFGAFHYAQQYPEHVDGIAVFAPYLGEAQGVEPIRAAGGLAQWIPPPVEPLTDANHAQQVWGYLHRITTGQLPSPELYLGCGDTDRMRDNVAVLAAALPKERVWTTPGGHSWGPWRALLEQFLTASAFKNRCAP